MTMSRRKAARGIERKISDVEAESEIGNAHRDEAPNGRTRVNSNKTGPGDYDYDYDTSIPVGQKRLLGCLEIMQLATFGVTS